MALFERTLSNKVLLDDTEPIKCFVENWKHVNGHTEFVIRVHRGPFSDQTWLISKRYNDFCKLHNVLSQECDGIDGLELPPKKFIGNMRPQFITERQRGLQKYLDTIFMNPILVSSLPARSFIDPANYCQPFAELALQHVSMALRGEVGWEVVNPINDMGWRLRKHFYLLKCKTMPQKEIFGSWTDYGPDKYLDDRHMHSVFKSLNQIQHPYIHPIELCLCTETGALFARCSNRNGSLRDILCGAKPKQSFLKKYGNPKGHKPLNVDQVALYGRQILEGLKFLQDKGFPYGHLHTGNVIIDDNYQCIKLSDIENSLLGVPSFYRPYFMQHKKINNMESIDVYCFGHVLYEMMFGQPLHESIVDDIPDSPSPIRNILLKILTSEACKNGLPKIVDLLAEPFFEKVNLKNHEGDGNKNFLKISTSVKEHLKMAVTKLEERLKDEQKMVRSQKRLVRVQEMMSSEEEKKKQKNKMKQEKMNKEHRRQSKSFDRVNSTNNEDKSDQSSGATSIGTATPPLIVTLPPPVAPPPPPQIVNGNGMVPIEHKTKDRSALLGAICNFNKANLRKTKTND